MPVLEIENLQKSYVTPEGRRVNVVEAPWFTLEEGEQAALQGASGSGKTTFLNLIAGIVRADAGRAVVAGKDMCALAEAERDHWRALNVGYVFQAFNLLQGFSALENVMLGMMFGRGADETSARHLLESVGLQERMHHLPRQLSAGQQQRVAVARAAANRPKLVLADEPTGSLDAERAAEAMGLIRRVCRESGAALLVVSHDRGILEQFEKVISFSQLNRAAAASS